MDTDTCKKCGKKLNDSVTTNLSDTFDGFCSDCVNRIFGRVVVEMKKSGYNENEGA